MIKKVLIFVLAFMLTIELVHAQQDSVGTFTKIVGRLCVLPLGQAEIHEANTGDLLYEGDIIKSDPDCGAIITMLNGTELKIATNTKLFIEPSKTPSAFGTEVFLPLGRVRAQVKSTGENSIKFRVRTPVAVASIRDGEVDVDVGEDIKTNVLVVEGLFDIESNSGTIQAADMSLNCKKGTMATIYLSIYNKLLNVSIPKESKINVTGTINNKTISLSPDSQTTFNIDPEKIRTYKTVLTSTSTPNSTRPSSVVYPPMAAAVNKESASYLNNRGWQCLKRNEWEKGKSDFEQAIKVDPKYPLPYGNLAIYYWVVKKDKKKALEYYELCFKNGFKKFEWLWDDTQDGHFIKGLNQTPEFRALVIKYRDKKR